MLTVLSLVPQLALRPSEEASRVAIEAPRALYLSEQKAQRAADEVPEPTEQTAQGGTQ